VLAAFMREVKQKDLRKVAVDLRGNPGGDSSVALAVLGSLGLHVEQGFSVDVRVSAQLLHDMPMFDPASVAPAFQAAGLAAPAADAREYLIPGRWCWVYSPSGSAIARSRWCRVETSMC